MNCLRVIFLVLITSLASCVADTCATSAIKVSVTNPLEALESPVIEWVAPNRRPDGSTIEAGYIKGYTIRYGRDSGAYTEEVSVSDPTVNRLKLFMLQAGTYYVIVRVNTEDESDSVISPEVVVEM